MYNMIVVKYDDNYYKDWDKFVLNSINGTLFHTRKFLSYHEKNKFIDSSILIYKKTELCCVFPCCYDNVNDEYWSHKGSSHGGPVISEKFYKGEYIEKIINEILQYYNYNLNMRIAETIFSKKYTDPIIYFLNKENFTIRKELSVYKKLLNDDNTEIEIFNDFHKRNLKYLKIGLEDKNFKTLKTIELSDYKEFYNLLIENLKKHNSTPTHSLQEFLLLNEMYKENSLLVITKKDNNIVSGIWNIIYKNVMYAFYIVKNYSYKEHFITLLNFNYSFNYAQKLKIKYFCFGICTEKRGQYLNKNLLKFKESMGGELINRYVIEKKYVKSAENIKNKKKFGYCISGGGHVIESCIKFINDNNLSYNVVLFFTKEDETFERFKKYNIESHIIKGSWKKEREQLCDKICKICEDKHVDYLILGFNKLLCGKLLNKFKNKIINIHPSLLPSFKGMGATELQYKSKCKFFGCTTHFIDEKMDEGLIICQGVSNIDYSKDYKYNCEKFYKILQKLIINTVCLVIYDYLSFENNKFIYKNVIYTENISPLINLDLIHKQIYNLKI